jgi:DNA-binding beta-propeller fold protein YncE
VKHSVRLTSLLVTAIFLLHLQVANAAPQGEKAPEIVDFGAIGVGSASTPRTVTLTFRAAATLGRVAVVSQGISGAEFSNAGTGSCKAGTQYRAGDRCTVNVTFIPKSSGMRYGAVVLEGGTGHVLATGLLQGNGSGTQGKQSAVPVNPSSASAQASGAATGATPAVGSASGSNSSFTCSVTSSNSSLISGTCTYQSSAQFLSGSQPNVNFGSINVGGSSSATAVTLNFAAAGALGSVTVLTEGAPGLDFANAGAGNCAVGTNYSVGSSCQVNVTFSPTLAGNRYGAVVLANGSGKVLATAYMQGTGIGPQVNFLPGTEIAVPTSALMYPFGVAIDAAGGIYIADAGNNRVLKETFSAGSYTESTVTTSALSYPTGLAIDAAGNVYIADTGNNRVLKETIFGGSYTESTVTTSTLSSPSGVAVDAAGNLYIADTGNNRILIEALAQGIYTETTVATSTLNGPTGVAVDANGDIYIADTGNNRVLIETVSVSGTVESTLATSPLSSPDAVTVDAFGNVYIADAWNNRVIEESTVGGNTVESTVATSALSGPGGVAVAGSGNIYIANTYNNSVLEEDLADTPSLGFAPTAPGQTSSDSPQMVTLLDVGNVALTLQVPGSGNNPSITSNFALGSNGGSICPVVSAGASTPGTLASGQSCMFFVSFTPAQAGTLTGALVLSDNALNAAATQSLALSGVGTGSTLQTITFGAIPAQLAGTILPLTATASSGLPVTITSTTPTVCTIAGATAQVAIAGTCTIVASQAGSAVYAAAAPVTQSFTVNLAPQTITFAAIPAQPINTAVPVVLSASASSLYPVTFTSITPTVCSVSNDFSTATLLAVGTCSIQASQAGDGLIYAAAPTVTQSFAVVALNAPVATSLGSVNIGSPSAPVAVSLTLANAATLGSISVLTEGASGLDFANAGSGSCATGVSYNSGSSCTVGVTFTPTVSGTRYGAVVLLDGSGNMLATAYLEGTGVGPQVNFLPDIEAVVPSSTLSSPFAVAVDGSGNVYIADANNNRVLKETLAGASYTETTVTTSTLSFPSGIAVDGAGNIYIADSGNNRVLEESPSAGGYAETTVETSALNYPSAVAVDGGGNVYIADSGNNRVLLESPIPGGYNETVVPSSQLAAPSGVAVDGSGNVYIADTENNRVLMETLSSGSYTESVLATSQLNAPSGIAVDGNGNIYIADAYNNRALKEQISSGTDIESVISTSALSAPADLAVDGNGNIYVVDTGNNRVLKENLSASPALSFASTAPGSTSSDSPQTITLENIGNAPLSFPAPGSGSNPSVPVNFSLASGGTACPVIGSGSPAGSLGADQSCLLSLSFAPTSAGTFSSAIVVTDTALNAGAPQYAIQSILVTGVGTGSTSQTITFAAIPAQTASATLQLTATASSGLAVSFTSTTPGVCTVAGSIATLAAEGTCTIVASQTGSAVYAPAPSVTQTFNVSLAAQTISFAAIPTQVINASAPVALNATASSGLPVNFVSTTLAVCTVNSSASTATLLSNGNCTIQASQPGDGVAWAAASPVTQTFAVESIHPQSAASIGTVNLGTSSAPFPITLHFSSAATLGSVAVLTQGASSLDFASAGGGSCNPGTNYSAGSNCTVNVTFTPKQPGSRFGAVVAYDGSGRPVSTAYFVGTGIGPQSIFAPGVETAVSTGTLSYPFGVAADGAGNIYIADTGNNRIVKETISQGAYTQSTVPTNPLAGPEGVAVDASGTIYIADTTNNRVLMEQNSALGYVQSVVPTSQLYNPSSVAVDGSGNLYISDTDNNRVLIEVPSAGSFTETQLPTSPLSSPYGLAVDGNGNVYIADSGNNRVLLETYASGGYTESTITTSPLNGPVAVALDGSANVYILDSGNSRVLIETLSAGTYSETVVPTSPMNAPEGIAVANGSVFIVDTNNDRMLWENLSAPPSLSFALTQPGQTSSDSPQTVVIANIGNSSLAFPVPPSGSNPAISPSFSLNSSAPAACPVVNAGASNPATLAAGLSCQLPISFTPPTSGSFSGSLSLTDNSLSVIGTQSIELSGGGTGSTQQTINFAAIGSQPVNSTVALSATASSGLPVSFVSTTPTVCTLSAANASLVAAGTCTIVASQAGSAVYAPATSVSQSFAITLLPQTISFPQISTQIINSASPVVLSATATSGLAVGFVSITPSVCSVNSAAATAMLLADGSCTIQAVQPGDGVIYAGAPPVTQTFTVASINPLTATVFAPVTIGSTGPAVTMTLNLNSATTLGNVAVLTGGATGLDFANTGTGTCTVGSSYTAGSSCTVGVTFSPRFAGISNGAVTLSDVSGAVVATAYLEAQGQGPQLSFLPGLEITIPTSGVYDLDGVAVDGGGSVYIVDNNSDRVVKESLSANGYSQSIVTTNLASGPAGGIAVDGSGNVYIADSNNDRILKETLSGGNYSESTVPTSTLSYPSGLAVDDSGNIYFADSNNNRILEETPTANGYSESTIPTSQLNEPSGVAVDSSGNVYIADSGNNRILKEAYAAGGYTESVVPTSSIPYLISLTVGPGGSLYIVDQAYGEILEETPYAGGYNETVLLSVTPTEPSGVAVDLSGNIYIADAGNSRVVEENYADAPSLTFALTAPGSTSSDSPQTVTLENVGTSPVNFAVPASGSNPGITGNFTLSSSGSSLCSEVSAGASAGWSIAAGQNCQLPISFTAPGSGTFTGAVALLDNSLNVSSSQTIQLTGPGAGNTQQTITFTPLGAPPYIFTTVTATASSGLPVTLSIITPNNCVLYGNELYDYAPGVCTIQANQSGSTVYAPATATLSVTVAMSSQTITFPPISTQAINTTTGLPLEAYASSGLPIVYTSLTPSICTISGDTAMLLADGTCTIQASQPGDGVIYLPAPSVTQSFTIQSVNPVTDTNFGSVNIGAQSSTTGVTINFNAAATIESVAVLTQGASGLDFTNAGQGSCTVGSSYTAGSSCTVNVQFTPTLAGTRYGAVEVADSTGNIVSTSFVQGTGVGPQLNFLPNAELVVPSSTLARPSGVGVDGSGNIYIVDTYNQRILEETPGPSGYTESTVPTSTLSYPYAIAVDGGGSLYIVDTGDNRILKETPGPNGFAESTVPSSVLNTPFGVAVDGSGNVYISDTYNDRVLMETFSGGTYTESQIPTSQLSGPYGVAVDGSGNIYIADPYNNRVLKETLSLGTYTESLVPSSAFGPFGLAVDGRGSVYISNYYAWGSGFSNVLKESYSNGSYAESIVQTSSLFGPYGVAVDGGGNVYVADTDDNRVLKEDFSDPPILNFALTAPGLTSTDSPQTVVVENVGNAPLTLPAVSGGTNPAISAGFLLNSGVASACPLVSAGASSATLPSGDSCVLPISFAPAVAQVYSGSLILTDNALNVAAPGYASQSIQLNGTGTGSTQQTISFPGILPQTLDTTVALTATASSGLAIGYTSLTPAICTVAGSTATLNAVGTCAVQATQQGSTVYAAAPPVTQNFMVNLETQTITFQPVAPQILNTSVPVQLNASSTSNYTVFFTSLTPSVCGISNYAATLSTTGTCTIQANQPGDGVTYGPAPPVNQSFTIMSVNPLTAISFGSINIGSTSAPVAVTLTFSTAATLGSASVFTQGASGLDFAAAAQGSCTAGNSYNPGDTCTVNVTFAPQFAGNRAGSVVLADGSSNVLATAYVEGIGIGPQITFLPGIESTITSSYLSNPQGLAVDGSGNVYIADYGSGVIFEESPSAGSYTQAVVPTSSLNGPSSVAVDGAGNIYIADTYNHRILEETPTAGSYTESTVQTSTLSGPEGVAVDSNGNVYVADTYSQRILMETPSAGSFTETVIPTSPLNWPTGIAADGKGNVYIADFTSYYPRVLKETFSAGGYTESTLPVSNFDDPQSVAVDGTGDVYITQWGSSNAGPASLLKLTASGGGYVQSTVPTSSLYDPSGVAVDALGNVYLATGGYSGSVLKEDLSDAPSLSFALTAPGSTSSDSPQTVTVANIGNAALTIPSLTNSNNPATTANFSIGSNSPNDCPVVNAGGSASGTVGAGQVCLLPVSFTAPSSGTITGTLTLTDNSLNAAAPGYATQTLQLNGLGSGSTQQTISFAPIPAQPLNSSFQLTATATSGLAVVFNSTTPSVCTVYSGNYVSLSAGGACSIQANQSGSTVYAPAPPVTQSFTVTLIAQTINFGPIAEQLFNSSVPVKLVASSTSHLAVTFASDTPNVCSVSGSEATLLTSGQCTIEADQIGNTTYAPATPVTQTFTIAPASKATGPNFGSVNIGSSGQPVSITFTFNAASTLGGVAVLTQGEPGLDFANAGTGTCAAGTSYNAGNTCTVAVTFTPTLSGSRNGAIVLNDGSGNVLATTYLEGVGIGSQINFLSGAESAVPSSAQGPFGVAVDGGGNVYVVDTYNNRVLVETLSAGSYTESTIPTSPLNGPSGVAVDGGGNVYIADTYNNRVLKETPASGSYTETVMPTSTLSNPGSVAVDGNGNVYIADTRNTRVLIEVPSAGSYIEGTVPNSATTPSHVAVDGSGNVYIADSGNNRVLLETLQSCTYTESTVPSSTGNSIEGLAVDGNANVYLALEGYPSDSVEVLIATSGTYIAKTIPTSSLYYPSGVAVDGSGNVYVTDLFRDVVLKEDLSDAPTLHFASTAIGSISTDSPQTVTLENLGNVALSFPVPASGQNPSIPANFTNNSTLPFSCQILNAGSPTPATLAVGQLCFMSISYAPTSAAPYSNPMVLNDTAHNAAAPGYATQIIQLTQGTQTTQTITFPAIPSQTVGGSVALQATASSGLTVTYTSQTQTICTISGANASMVGGGTCTIEADQSGNSIYQAAPSVTQSFTVNPASQTITFTPPTSPVNFGVSPITLVAAATSGLPVTFSVVSGPGTMSGNSLTITGVGTVVVAANQAGNASYLAASQVTQSVVVNLVSPAIASVSPASGAIGASITITGMNFGPAQSQYAHSVTFNGVAATSITSWCNTSIVVIVPAGATTGNLVVTQDGLASNGVPFTVVPPTISLSPTSGPIGASVTITGTNFGPTYSLYSSSVLFSGTNTPASITSWSNTSIVAIVPPGATTGNVVVNVGGQVSNGVLFTVLAPTITSLSPNSGAIGSSVTITGTNFGPAYSQYSSLVTFNGTQVLPTSVASWSNTSIVVAVPAGATTGNVVVNQGGQVSNGKAFTVLAPRISSLSPTFGAIGNSVTITGTNFGPAYSQYSSLVTFNGTQVLPTSVMSWSNTSIVVAVPAGATTGNVVVSQGGQVSDGVKFTVLAITSLTPVTGGVGSSVTIKGTSFGTTQGPSTVTFNGTVATSITSWSSTQIKAIVPAGATSGNVVVTVNGVASNGVTFTVTPAIVSLSPAFGPVGTYVTITGTDFGPYDFEYVNSQYYPSTVTFNGMPSNVISWSDTSIVATVPVGATTGNVVVTVGGQPSNGVAFTVLAITSLTPASGVVGTSVTIKGTSFGATQGASTVSFNGVTATSITSWSNTSIKATVPAGATSGNVVVTVNGVASNGETFTVTPSISSVSPTFGAVGTSVTITGTNFGPYDYEYVNSVYFPSTVTFNGMSANVLTWSDTSIVVTVPVGATTGNVVVTVGAQPSNGVAFTVLSISSLTPVAGAVGSSVTIKGASFGAAQGASTVSFNGITATSIASWSNTSIKATVPAGASSGNVVVTVNGVASNGVTFTVVPSISSLSPTTGVVGTTVTITGANFGQNDFEYVNSVYIASTVTFNGMPANVTSWSDTSIVATVPVGGTTGNVVVTVGGQASNGVKFTVLVPTISSLSPASAAIGATVTIRGTNFGLTQGQYTSSVTFNGAPVLPTSITSWSNTAIVVAVPAGATTGNVVVTLSQVASNGVTFTVLAPAISSLSPTSGAISSTVTIKGTNFGPAYSLYSSTVTFNNAQVLPTSVASWSNTSIVVAVPAGATTGDVVVNQGGQISNGVPFTVLAPTIKSLSPTSGAIGSTVTITGNNFGPTYSQYTSSVLFNGTNTPASITSWSNTSIVVTVPAEATTGNVVVNQGGQVSNGVTFTVLAPIISSLSPIFGVRGASLAITGTNFDRNQSHYSGTNVFNGAAATWITHWSNAPPNALGNKSFYECSNLLAAIPIFASGQAIDSTRFLSANSHRVSAIYAGATNYALRRDRVNTTLFQ